MMMVQYSHTKNIDDDSSDDDDTNYGSVFTHWYWPVDDSEDDPLFTFGHCHIPQIAQTFYVLGDIMF